MGGGYIGLEVAAVARKHGLEVSVIEAARQTDGALGLSANLGFLPRAARGQGVRLRLNATALAYEGVSRVEAVSTSGGRVAADFVIAGIGVVPNCELALKAGILCDNGIAVDEFGATSDPAIFAAGDCTSHPAL